MTLQLKTQEYVQLHERAYQDSSVCKKCKTNSGESVYILSGFYVNY